MIRLSYALVDVWMDSYQHAPSAVTLDIDDTVDVVHGRQQLSLFNAYYDEHCFLPIHVYDTARSRPVAVILRPGKVPSGVEVRAHLRRLVRRIRRRWPDTRITFRGDSHYACPEAMAYCDHNNVDYIFGLTGNKPLARKVDEVSDAVRTERALGNKAVVRSPYWLPSVREPEARDLAGAEFNTNLGFKIAARVRDAARVRLAFRSSNLIVPRVLTRTSQSE